MVSPIGLGTVKLGRNQAVKYPVAYEIPDDLQAADLLREAQRGGVTLLDTAPAYGEAEERLGRIIGACGGRDRWTICTKVGEQFDPTTGTSRFDFSPDAIRVSLTISLKRLKTDRADIVLLHSDGNDDSVLNESGGLDALHALKRKGMVRWVGISTKTPAGGVAAVVSGRCDVVMLTLNEREQSDLPAIREAGARGVGVLIKKSLASGHAVGDGAVEQAMALCFAESGVSSVVVGTTKPAHLRGCIEAAKAVLGRAGRS